MGCIIFGDHLHSCLSRSTSESGHVREGALGRPLTARDVKMSGPNFQDLPMGPDPSGEGFHIGGRTINFDLISIMEQLPGRPPSI